uniref:Nucleolar protein 56 n=1 Tax=Timema bartmani TaxID=61472 RepID=A0A7R9EWL1_9NEOP|nr:unnamed protein product [Timema bartmani]
MGPISYGPHAPYRYRSCRQGFTAQMFVLFEHAAGYALFRVKEFEETGMLLPQVEESVTDISRFNSVVKLVGFSPFKTALKALENLNSISEGILPEDLQLFLETFLPKSGKKSKVILGVSEPKIGASITESIGITCQHVGAIPEIIRGIRQHFPKLVKGFTAQSSSTAQLGLGHSYSRAKVKFNVNRVDNMIIQSIALLDQLDKDINTFSMRIREWYSYHFPELVKIVPENYLFAKVARFVKNRKELNEEKLEALEEIVMDSGKAQAILDASRSSMADYRKELSGYLATKMQDVAPNLATLIGDQVGARLISHAGSLTNLAKYPASTYHSKVSHYEYEMNCRLTLADLTLTCDKDGTVGLLNAEALKTRGNTPKYGLLYHSTFIGRAGAKNKGRISRYLANKCSIASRIDCFIDEPTKVFGEKLRQQVEDRLKFYETGDIPRKNIDVMKEALEEIALTSPPKKKKKNKKRKREEESDLSIANGDVNGEEKEINPPPKKKKKKNKKEKDE